MKRLEKIRPGAPASAASIPLAPVEESTRVEGKIKMKKQRFSAKASRRRTNHIREQINNAIDQVLAEPPAKEHLKNMHLHVLSFFGANRRDASLFLFLVWQYCFGKEFDFDSTKGLRQFKLDLRARPEDEA